MRRPAQRATRGVCLALSLAGGCLGSLEPPPPRSAEQFTAGRELFDLAALARLRSEAEAAPEQLDVQWHAGMAHVRASLRGHVDQRDHAERYLERAWRLDPTSEQVPAARVLARFLNMRSSVLDLSKIELQIELYRVQLGAQLESPLEPQLGDELDAEQFHIASFHAAAEVLATYANGETVTALRELAALERAMQARTLAHPEDIDTCTMAGNFELIFAGVIPVGVERRLRRGIDYLELQQDHWQQLSPRARNTGVAPNVRSVFALHLAEALLAWGDAEAAAARYASVIALSDQPETSPRAQIVAVAEHRLANLDAYLGERELLPPWPSGVTGCVACHGSEATLPLDELHRLPGVELHVPDAGAR